eukprot:GHVL01008033.1.p1 GENE.GHVL01008033.1~~GHVL01008033.1.p1  ORF type:complete len:228 (-),score=35.72 GHVL01008033.1:490-1173(-)
MLNMEKIGSFNQRNQTYQCNNDFHRRYNEAMKGMSEAERAARFSGYHDKMDLDMFLVIKTENSLHICQIDSIYNKVNHLKILNMVGRTNSRVFVLGRKKSLDDGVGHPGSIQSLDDDVRHSDFKDPDVCFDISGDDDDDDDEVDFQIGCGRRVRTDDEFKDPDICYCFSDDEEDYDENIVQFEEERDKEINHSHMTSLEATNLQTSNFHAMNEQSQQHITNASSPVS